jgi:hypothetical protein
MNYFLDTEFLEGSQKTFFGKTKPTIDLISIGIVSENNREYYAISKDFNLKEAWNRWQQRTGEGDRNNIEPRLYWLRDNVLKPIYKELLKKENNSNVKGNYMFGFNLPVVKYNFTYKNFKKLIDKYGKTNKQIAEEVKVFCTEDILSIEKAKFYEVQHKPCKFYAYYADYDWVAFCWLFGKMIDLPNGFSMYCRDLKQILDEKEMARQDGTDMVELRNMSNYPKQENEHNALDDAKWNFKLFQFLQGVS